MPQWTVYSRPDCSLCDQLLEELASVLSPSEAERVQVIDVSQDRELKRKYGLRIPVLMADGEFVCAYRLDVERVRAVLGQRSS